MYIFCLILPPLSLAAIFQFLHAQNTFFLNTIQGFKKDRLFLESLCGFHISKPALLSSAVSKMQS